MKSGQGQRRLGRGIGVATLGAGLAMIGQAVAEARGSAMQGQLGIAFNLLLIPLVIWFGVTLRRGGQVVALVGGLAGLGSVLLWGGAFAFGWFHLELLWIGLSAVWWLALAQLMRERERRIAILTAVTGVAAALDAAVTGIELVRQLPIAAFALLGGWKLPFQLVWTFVVGLLLLARARLGPSPGAGSRSRN